MGAFKENVRRSKIPHPPQRSFTLKKWTSAFQKQKTQTPEDKALFVAGIFVAEKLAHYRATLGPHLTSAGACPRIHLTRIILGTGNRNASIAINGPRTVDLEPGSDTFYPHKAMEKKISVQPTGQEYTMDEALQNSVDGIEPALVMIEHGLQSPTSQSVKFDLHDASMMVYLAQAYDALESFWAEILWCDWTMYIEDGVGWLGQPEDVLNIERKVAELRRELIAAERMSYVLSFMQDKDLRKKLMSEMTAVMLTGTGKSKGFKTKAAIKLDSDAQDYLVYQRGLRVMAVDGYTGTLLAQSVGKHSSFGIEDVMEIWELLAFVGWQQLQRLPMGAAINSLAQLSAYAPSYSIAQFLAAAAKATKKSPQVVREIYEFLLFRREDSRELWANPIVELGAGKFAFSIMSVCLANVSRNIEIWLKQTQIDISGKGGEFEKHVRRELADAIEKQAKLGATGVLDYGVVAGQQGNSEEIDLLFWIANTIYIVELKCTLYPTSGLEWHNGFGVLKGASAQAKRKCDFAASMATELLTNNGLSGQIDPKSCDFRALVVSSQPFGTGAIINGVPVLDLTAFLSFFSKGCIEMLGGVGPDGLVAPQFSFVLYDNDDEANRVFDKYCQSPPIVALYRNSIAREKVQQTRLSSDEVRWGIDRLKTKLPESPDEMVASVKAWVETARGTQAQADQAT